MGSVGTIHEPPTQATLASARNSCALPACTPPVGQNFTSPKGPCQALSMGTPPACSAGKNFSSVWPSSCASMTSLPVATPGSSGRPRSWQALPTERV